MNNEQWVLANRPEGQQDLKQIWKLQSCPMPSATEEGEVVGETLYISVDPYLSSGIKKSALGGAVSPIGSVQYSLTVSRIIMSKNSKFPVGTLLLAANPWQRYYLFKGDKFMYEKIIKKPNDPENIFDQLGLQSALGTLGMPTMTAYYGVKEVGVFSAKDVVVVSGAAGAVGSVAAQLAKHVFKCKKVIGVAGGKAKCDYLVSQLGLDASIDYKEYNTKEKMGARLQELAGEPITAYFDNTGGVITDAIFDVIGKNGRIIICGQISTYNKSEEKPEETNIYPNYLSKTVYKALTISGFVVSDYMPNNEVDFYPNMGTYLEKGLVKTKDTIVNGFEKTAEAYEMLYTGGGLGKIIVKV